MTDAIALAKSNDIKGAIALFKKAEQFSPGIDLNPDTKELDTNPQTTIAPFIVQNAIVLAKNNDIEDAIALFKQAQELNADVDLNPDTKDKIEQDAEALAKELAAPSIVRDAIALAKSNDIKGAIALFQKAQKLNSNVDLIPHTEELDKNPSISAYLYRAINYYGQEEFNSALEDLDKIIEINSNYAYAHWGKGDILSKLGKKQKARNSLETAAKLYKKQGNIEYYQGVIQALEELDSK